MLFFLELISEPNFEVYFHCGNFKNPSVTVKEINFVIYAVHLIHYIDHVWYLQYFIFDLNVPKNLYTFASLLYDLFKGSVQLSLVLANAD